MGTSRRSARLARERHDFDMSVINVAVAALAVCLASITFIGLIMIVLELTGVR